MATDDQRLEQLMPQLEEKLAAAAREYKVPGVAVGIRRSGEEQCAY